MHVGNRVKEILDLQGRSVTWLAAQIPCERSNVYNIFRRENLDVGLLLRISIILRYDFFLELSEEYKDGLAENEI